MVLRMVQKKKLARSKKYLEWIRSLPCVVTGRTDRVVAHHVTVSANRGMGLKPSDFWCLPIDWFEHQKLHANGEASYWGDLGLDPHRLASDHLFSWLCEDSESSLELLRALDEYATSRYV